MGTCLLRGITTALMVTVLTLFAGIVWGAMGLGGLSTSRLLDIGLLASCLVGGYRSAKESGSWWMGGATGVGYVAVGTLLLALFLPIRLWGFIQVLGEGAIIGLIAGAVGAGGAKGVVSGTWSGKRRQSYFKPSYAGYDSDDHVSSEFDWGPEESFQERETASNSFWAERSEGKFQGTRGSKWDTEESSDVEWSWDQKDDDRLPSLGAGDSEALIDWEPELVRNDVVKSDVVKSKLFERNRTSLKNASENNEKAARPWWEE
ncbi:TIGR04086 family membrane protein [Desulfosporosinus sp. OT]|uniref:TIGR04086 family membrane protein n=1 Tax=Desulfosporosinus sp. OT TaxID=913865 RepID=UPI000223A784|nr:TIGR04086 family membrane protein [Desulfosporosinus sp. OT]EGW38430.1 hypothetical protein DOT_3710 [Desulfosporosinus sp. OT]